MLARTCNQKPCELAQFETTVRMALPAARTSCRACHVRCCHELNRRSGLSRTGRDTTRLWLPENDPIPFVRLAATCPENGFTGLWTEGAIPDSPFGRSSLISCASSAAPTRSEPSPQCNRSQYLLDAGVPSRGRSVSCQLGPAPCVREEDWWTLSGSG